MSSPFARHMVQQPLADDFADLFGLVFVGPGHERAKPKHLGKVAFTLEGLQRAIRRLKMHKDPDTVGIAAELLKFIPDDFLQCLLEMYNFVLLNGLVPPVWKETVFAMLPNKMCAVQASNFRPTANTRLFYKIFEYMLLRGWRTLRIFTSQGHSTAFVQTADWKTFGSGITIWVVSLDLSKVFDRVRLPALWTALERQSVSQHLIWLLHKCNENQTGEVKTESGRSRAFSISAGVRQGCVLSPRLFNAVLQEAMETWRCAVAGHVFNLGDGGMERLFDLRFADDILSFAVSASETALILEELIDALAGVGL